MIELLVRVVISMAVVMAVMGVAARMVRRRQGSGPSPGATRWAREGAGSGAGSGGGQGSGLRGAKSRKARPVPPIEVVYRRPLAKGAWATVVQAADKRFLVGVTEQSVTLLAELPSEVGASPSPAADAAAAPHPMGSFGDIENWQQTDRMPVCLTDAADEARSDHAWKLGLDSLRERTVRR